MEQSRFRCGDRDPEYLGGLMQRAFLQLIFSAGERSAGWLDGDHRVICSSPVGLVV
jgi:hypothetical protein